jgi:predicted nucleotidyltransferase
MGIPAADHDRAFSRFVAEVKCRYRPALFLLFGSRAKGQAPKDSDHDLLIVSSRFQGVPVTDRMTDIYKMWSLREGLDCLCLTPEEFDRASVMISVVQLAFREGIAL